MIVSGILGIGLGRSTPPVATLVAGLEGEYVAVTSPRLLDALHAVLLRPRFGLSDDLAARWTNLVAVCSHVVRTGGRLGVLTRDPADNDVLECALRSRAGFLVTGNMRHFEELPAGHGGEIVYGGLRILGPAAFGRSVLGL